MPIFERFGVDKDGNIFALVRFYHTYWANKQINYDKGDYELLKWTPAGEFLFPNSIFGEGALNRELQDVVSVHFKDENAEEESAYVDVYDSDEGNGFYLRKIAGSDDNKFTGLFYDEKDERQVMGIFTAVE